MICATVGLIIAGISWSHAAFSDQRNMVSYLRGPYNIDFFYRHNAAFRISAAIHFAHAKQHDILQLTPAICCRDMDVSTDVEYLHCLYNPPRTEPTMEYYGPYVAQSIFNLYRAIDWTHMHHEQTYDILSERSIPWHEKKQWTDRAVEYYLETFDIPRSPAPLDVTMRRAAIMMKPYFTLFRNYYPRSNNFFYAAHWWHPVIYEAMMLGGNDEEQESMVMQTDVIYFSQVLENRPLRMLLSREAMPRYSRLSPESANIFDNLHMLHGIAYDILAYEGWSLEQKKAEMERVIRAMSYQPGDRDLARKFIIPHPDMDPRVYYDWMQSGEGDMTRIMREMLDEMMPHMMQGGMDEQMRGRVFRQFAMKMRPGIEQGESEGSLHDALKKLMPDMQMSHEAMEPGVADAKMVEMMLEGWREKYGNLPDVAPISMDVDPMPPVLQDE
ncbi:MAG: hypothetical protein C4520_18685 [Candidatus Abyssobacteria bacterium SURF_5]|uniref:Uncharacterized protein n=1 Tax=Abyssobacteria bacterium (strain SURF_5) TaxID=2093360 RepID=A0A3A4N2G2_ABYX5|nr:MAG: hypothetical protein C4520_18685 [Candidatus Abyssubacteria bacterium SURF_5]